MFEIQKYIKYALKFTHQREDAEDCIQQAFLIYTKYKDKLDISNPEKTIMWLIRQETIRLNKQKNLQSSGKILKFEDMYLSLPVEDRSERIDSKYNRVSFNEGPQLYDFKVLKSKLNYKKKQTLREKGVRLKKLYLGEVLPVEKKTCNLSLLTNKLKYLNSKGDRLSSHTRVTISGRPKLSTRKRYGGHPRRAEI